MAGEDLYLSRGSESALRTTVENRQELVRFYKSLATMSKQKLGREMRDAESKSAGLSDAEKTLEERIRDYCARAPDLTDEEMVPAVGKLSLAMFMIDRAKTLHDLVMINDSLSLYSLYISLRNRIGEILVRDFYSKGLQEALGDYADVEPIITACSEVCGLPAVSIKDLMSLYRRKLSDRVADYKE